MQNQERERDKCGDLNIDWRIIIQRSLSSNESILWITGERSFKHFYSHHLYFICFFFCDYQEFLPPPWILDNLIWFGFFASVKIISLIISPVVLSNLRLCDCFFENAERRCNWHLFSRLTWQSLNEIGTYVKVSKPWCRLHNYFKTD